MRTWLQSVTDYVLARIGTLLGAMGHEPEPNDDSLNAEVRAVVRAEQKSN